MEYQVGDRVECISHLAATDEWPSRGDYGTIETINKFTDREFYYSIRWDTCKKHVVRAWGKNNIKPAPAPKTNREALFMLRR